MNKFNARESGCVGTQVYQIQWKLTYSTSY